MTRQRLETLLHDRRRFHRRRGRCLSRRAGAAYITGSGNLVDGGISA
ncbi:hypothetical protein K9B32_18965 [Rhizobium sp. 3T7]|nr:hypothetical protein [Rhizobium sp. 3T7]MBZ9792177.1 hypothetical protein [Rhizobium sp. 3T7]